MRLIVVALLSCAVFSAVLLVNQPPSEASADTGQAAVDQAYTYVGAPYGVNGLDCSGFTSAVYADLGIYLPDDPAAQYATGHPRARRPATSSSSTSTATASLTSASPRATGP